MTYPSETIAIAFDGPRRIAAGRLAEVAVATKDWLDRCGGTVMVFDAHTSRPIDLDFRGTSADVVARLTRPAPPGHADTPVRRGPGRPKLGVVPREVTLLPRHWEWLNGQPGGASAALRRLVEDARRAAAERVDLRGAREVVYRFMSPMAGNLFGFEEATRALYRGDAALFDALISAWPDDIRDHLRMLAVTAFEADAPTMDTIS